MQTFTKMILAIYSHEPAAATSQITQRIGVPPIMIRQARAWLGSTGYLEKDENLNWHATDIGLKALRDFDRDQAIEEARFLSEAVGIASKALGVDRDEISGFVLMDKGMTNDSYIFLCRGKKYIYRRAGQGSEMLVDRYREYSNYLVLQGRGISDVVVYHNPLNGTKIAEFIEESKGIDTNNPDHMKEALRALHNLHNADIVSPHDFDFLKTIDFYEEICHNAEVEFFPRYYKYKEIIKDLLAKVDKLNVKKCFCHIDFVPGNCLLNKEGKVVLIDWEYSGRQDPIVDVAMFCISAAFDKKRSDALLLEYLERDATKEEWARFYTYIATAGLMWSLWSEFKTANGEIFEGYTKRTFNLCRRYSKLASELFNEIDAENDSTVSGF